MGSSWLDWFRALYPVALTLFGVVGSCVFLWLIKNFVTLTEHAKVAEKVSGHGTRLTLLEDKIEASPTRQSLHDEIGDLGERMASVESSVKGLSKQSATIHDYVKMLVDNSMRAGSK